MLHPVVIFVLLASIVGVLGSPASNDALDGRKGKDARVLILGGGVTGVIAARTLHSHGIDDLLIVEANHELGGRLKSFKFGAPGKEVTLEAGANWVQSTFTGKGPVNPIFTLAKKHGLKTQLNDYDDLTTYDFNGPVDYIDVESDAFDALTALTVTAGERVDKQLADGNSRTGFSLSGWRPKSNAHHAAVSEYYNFDWEYAQTPEQTSWIAAAWNNNFSFVPESGGFGGDNLLSIDQRGFKHFIQAEAATFLKEDQTMFNSTVRNITYTSDGVEVTLKDGKTLRADHALVTFSLGVLQNNDVSFHPELPEWKQEAIFSDKMATYTKIFLQFPSHFWFDTQMALFADKVRGFYPVWQSLDHKDFLAGSGIVFVTVTGDFSERIEQLPDSTVQSEVLSVLRNMFPNTTIPEPEAFHFPRWHSDPLFRGSYSNWPPNFLPAHFHNLRDNVGKVWFAGEYTSEKYFGFLHGAYFEGLDAGQRIANCISGKGSCTTTKPQNVVAACEKYDI